jgi:hypothetical protein
MPNRAPRVTDEELARANVVLAKRYGHRAILPLNNDPWMRWPKVQLTREVVDRAVADMFGPKRYVAGDCRKRITFPILPGHDSITLEIEHDAPESP